MTLERYLDLVRDEDDIQLTEDEIAAGYHWCVEWDGMLIGPHDMEAEVCRCFEPESVIGKLYSDAAPARAAERYQPSEEECEAFLNESLGALSSTLVEDRKRMPVFWNCDAPVYGGLFVDRRCGNRFSTTAEIEEYQYGRLSAICPKCNTRLDQTRDNPTFALTFFDIWENVEGLRAPLQPIKFL